MWRRWPAFKRPDELSRSGFAPPPLSESLQIRSPLEADFAAIGDIFYQAVHHLGCRDYTPQQLRAWAPEHLDSAHWRRRTLNLEVRIGVIGEEQVGFIGFSPSGYIDLLFTHPAHARRGVARGLLSEAENILRRAGVELATTQASLTARHFFETTGYTCIRAQEAICHGVAIRNFHMEKKL